MPSPRYTREIPQRYRLEAAACDGCGKIFFPPRLVCSQCGSQSFTATRLTDTGTVVTFTIIHVGPDRFVEETPYAVGIVELDNGVRVTGQIVDCALEDIRIGSRARFVFRKIQEEGESGLICYGYKFRLMAT